MGKGKIKDKLKNLKREKYKFLASVDDPNDEDEEEIEYTQDCFEDMPRRDFGWSVKVSLRKNESCTFTPKLNPDMPPCIMTDASAPPKPDTLEERQTGENFKTAAPLDCRVQYVCDTNTLGDAIRMVAQERGVDLPVDPAPVDPLPVDPAPVDPAPVDPAPVDLAPVDQAA